MSKKKKHTNCHARHGLTKEILRNKVVTYNKRCNLFIGINSVTLVDLSQILDQTHCYICGEYVFQGERTIDHKVALFRFGENS